MGRILLVEDDVSLARTIMDWLKFEGHSIEYAPDGGEAVRLLHDCDYDLLVLDWELPNIEGVDICRLFRAKGGMTPIIMLTGKSLAAEKIAGFDAGVDDYLTKPFNMKELAVRIRALLRRPVQMASNVLRVGQIELDTTAHKAFVNGTEVHLQPKEFAVLEFLMTHKGQVYSADALFVSIWDHESESSIETVRTCLKKLRKKLSDESGESIIKNVHGVGYLIEA